MKIIALLRELIPSRLERVIGSALAVLALALMALAGVVPCWPL